MEGDQTTQQTELQSLQTPQDKIKSLDQEQLEILSKDLASVESGHTALKSDPADEQSQVMASSSLEGMFTHIKRKI